MEKMPPYNGYNFTIDAFLHSRKNFDFRYIMMP